MTDSTGIYLKVQELIGMLDIILGCEGDCWCWCGGLLLLLLLLLEPLLESTIFPLQQRAPVQHERKVRRKLFGN